MAGQRALIQGATAGTLDCSGCGPLTKGQEPPTLALPGLQILLVPQFDQGVMLKFADDASADMWLLSTGTNAAPGALLVEVRASTYTNCVVVVFWGPRPAPPLAVICANCPPGTKTGYVPASDQWLAASLGRATPPSAAYVLEFDTPTAADDWVTAEKAGYLAGTLWQRVTLA